jgi:hypothetical protein
MGQKKTPLI